MGRPGDEKIAPQGVEKLSIVDDADPAGYNITKMEKGAVTDGAKRRTQLDGAAGEGVDADLPGHRGGDESGRPLGQGNLRGTGSLGLSEQAWQTLQERGVPIVEMGTTEDKVAYSQLLDEARAADPINGWAVTPKTVEELADCKILLSDDGGVGAAIAPDGDIEAVFRNQSRHQEKGTMRSVLPQAIAAGGVKLDCYGKALARIYTRDGGFVPVARVTFNPEFANPGWNESNGKPDIYVMMATDTDPDIIIQKQGSYHYWTDAELAALPLMEYDEAMAYRDRLLAEQLSSKGSSLEIGDGAPNSVGAAAIAYVATGTVTASTTTVLSAGASWAATMTASGATTSATIGRTFEKWFYAFNNVATKAQQVVINGVGRVDALFNGKIYELKNYNWGNYSTSQLNRIANSFVAQAQRYMNVGSVNGSNVNGVVFYFSSKPPENIISALKAIGVAVQWVPNS